jgi:hypothetical protein
MEIRVKGNQIRFIYNDDLSNLMNQGKTVVKRASHVEPDGNGRWIADMSPVNGPVLGPYNRRDEALQREVEWLLKHKIPTPA